MPALLSPRLLPLHLAGVLAVVLAGWLGSWQVGVWQDHRSDKADQLAEATPIPLEEVMGPDDAFPRTGAGQPVVIDGTWMPDDTVYAKREAGGYWVVTPLQTADGSAMLVVRGQADAPAAPPVSGPATVTGWLQPADGGGAEVVEDRADVVGALSVSELIGNVGYDLYSGFVIAETPLEPALVAVTPDSLPKPDSLTSIRNLLYGIEWWVFGAFAAFIWWRWARDMTTESEDLAADPRL